MNYYNPNYMYGGNPQYFPSYQQSSLSQVMPSSALNGKVVDSIDIAKVSEVPIGGYSIFPKADLSEIYIKIWNSDTKKMDMLSYKLDTEKETETDTTGEILKRIDVLEQKLDNLLNSAVKEEAPKAAASKGGSKNVF